MPRLEHIVARSNLFRLKPMPPIALTEAAWLGLDPLRYHLSQGPLTVAAFGADPPPRSVHFHLSLMTHADGQIEPIEFAVDDKEVRELLTQAERLNTRNLTIVHGAGLDHGLVWEQGSIDLHTTPPHGAELKQVLPQGDGEPLLRRFIDDSINLLSDLDMNKRRMDEERPPLNLLWPWGQGFREPMPNLALMRGEPAVIACDSLRLRGLAALCGYRNAPTGALGSGTNLRLEVLRETAESFSPTVIHIDTMARLRKAGRLDEAAWLSRELDDRLLPITDDAPLFRLTIAAPGVEGGLALVYDSMRPGQNIFPFDERSLHERALPLAQPWEIVEKGLQNPALEGVA